MEDLYVIVGLGNPGPKYNATRHNVGFEALEYLSEKYSININKLKFKSLYGEGNIAGKRVLLVKPQTYMNASGECVREIIEWYKIDPKQLIVLYDDIDLPVGKIRVRQNGSAGTHNGMRSIIYQIRTEDFKRVRIGIGKPPPQWDLADYVLGRFAANEVEEIKKTIIEAAEATVDLLNKG